MGVLSSRLIASIFFLIFLCYCHKSIRCMLVLILLLHLDRLCNNELISCTSFGILSLIHLSSHTIIFCACFCCQHSLLTHKSSCSMKSSLQFHGGFAPRYFMASKCEPYPCLGEKKNSHNPDKVFFLFVGKFWIKLYSI